MGRSLERIVEVQNCVKNPLLYELKLIVENITAYSRGDIDLDAVVNTFKAVRGGVVTSTMSRILQSVALLEGTCKAMNRISYRTMQ
jgi:hypothetical protein